MSGIYRGGVESGIAQGINQATLNIMNLYGMKQKLDIQKQNADNYRKLLNLSTASRAVNGFDVAKWQTPQMRQPVPGQGGAQPGRMNFGLPAQLETDPAYMEAGVNNLFDGQ